MNKDKRVWIQLNVPFENYQNFYFAWILFRYRDFLFMEQTKQIEKHLKKFND